MVVLIMSPTVYTKKDIEELIRTLRGYDGVPGVMERLVALETSMKNIEKNIDDWVKAQQQQVKAVDNDALVSWSWVRDKIVQPSFMLFVGWLLFSFIPDQLAD